MILCQCHPHPQNLWEGQQFFRIRYYTLRLAKSDVFTPKLWEAKWIVDEVTCILTKQKRINSYLFKSFDSMGELKTLCIGQAPLIWLCHKPQINFKILKKSLSRDQNIWLLWQLQNNFSKWQNGKMLIEMMFCSTWNSCATRRSWRVYRWGCIAMNNDRLGLVGTGWDGLV